MRLGLLALALLVSACGCSRGSSARAIGAPERQVLLSPADQVTGLSGLDVRDDGSLIMVPERARVLLVRDPAGAITRLPIRGVRRGCDLESVADLGGDRIALGIEQNIGGDDTETGRGAVVALARVAGGEVTVTELLEVDTAIWGIAVLENQGVEGLCHAGDYLVAGIETVGDGQRGRFAPVGVYHLVDRRWTPYRLRLSSDSGALAALTCRVRDGALELWAVERHFGVLRILRARVPAAAGELEAELIADLDDFAESTGLNIEGITVTDDGDLLMVNDNRYRTISGPSELLILREVAR